MMVSTTDLNPNSTESTTESPQSTTESTEHFNLSDYLLKNYIVIIIPSVFLCVFLIIIFIILISKILKRRRFDPKQLETYSSVTYDDDENLDEELGSTEDYVYTSCKLLVGGEYDDTSDMTNSEPEYDCMSVDVSINANQSSIVDFNPTASSQATSENVAQSLKTLPYNFWKR